MNKRKWFTEMALTPEEDAVHIIEMTMKNLEYEINLIGKVATGFERIDRDFEGGSPVGKMPSNSITCNREIVHERKSQSIWQLSLFSHLKKLSWPPQPSLTTNHSDQSAPSTSRQDPVRAKPLYFAEGTFFISTVFFIRYVHCIHLIDYSIVYT